MTERLTEDPSDSTPRGAGAGRPIPEYLLRSLPELRVLTDRAAFLVWQNACRKRTQRSNRSQVLSLAAVVALCSALGGFGGPVLARLLGRIGIGGSAAIVTASVAASLIAMSASILLFVWRYRGRNRRIVRETLVALGHPVCIHCGYDLRGSPEPRCPECGTRVSRDDSSAENASGVAAAEKAEAEP